MAIKLQTTAENVLAAVINTERATFPLQKKHVRNLPILVLQQYELMKISQELTYRAI